MKLCEKLWMSKAERPQTGFERRRKLYKYCTFNKNLWEGAKDHIKSSQNLQSHKQVMYNNSNITKTKKIAMLTPIDGIPTSSLPTCEKIGDNLQLNIQLSERKENINKLQKNQDYKILMNSEVAHTYFVDFLIFC